MFCVGRRDGNVAMAEQGSVLILRLYGDVASHDIVTAFHIAQAGGSLSSDRALLVDLRHFVGSVDWSSIRELREMAPWSQSSENRSLCAYLLETGDIRSYLVTVVAALYPAVQHRSFTDEAAALAWIVTTLHAARVVQYQTA